MGRSTMKKSFSKSNILKLISNLEGYENKEIEEFGEAYKLLLSHKNKKVEITWPYEIGEIFLDFFENDVVIFQDWFECMEADELTDFISYTDNVSKRFLFYKTRVKKKGFIFTSMQLQYQSKEEWRNILHG